MFKQKTTMPLEQAHCAAERLYLHMANRYKLRLSPRLRGLEPPVTDQRVGTVAQPGERLYGLGQLLCQRGRAELLRYADQPSLNLFSVLKTKGGQQHAETNIDWPW